jgi:putative transposase
LPKKLSFLRTGKSSRQKITGLHEKIADARRDFLHKLSTVIAGSFGFVVVEDLRTRNMSASARGTVQDPGRNVKAKSGLNRSILDQGWSEFFRQLEYKLLWVGGWLEKVKPHYTSRTCPVCSHVDKNNRKSQSGFKCVKCLFEGNADHVAAINIHTAGHAGINACGDEGLPSSVKQEPPGTGNLVPAFS